MLYPDVYVTKFFFKSGLADSPGDLLELGCGNGNNARLFTEFGWNAIGIDMSADGIADARANWSEEPSDSWSFIQQDLRDGLPELEGSFNALVGNGSLYYFEGHHLENVLTTTRPLLAPGAHVYFKFRTPEDWRCGKGPEIEHNTFMIEATETGEAGSTMAFYEPDELCEIHDSTLGPLQDRHVLLEAHQNVQHGTLIDNRDVVVWGRI